MVENGTRVRFFQCPVKLNLQSIGKIGIFVNSQEFVNISVRMLRIGQSAGLVPKDVKYKKYKNKTSMVHLQRLNGCRSSMGLPVDGLRYSPPSYENMGNHRMR